MVVIKEKKKYFLTILFIIILFSNMTAQSVNISLLEKKEYQVIVLIKVSNSSRKKMNYLVPSEKHAEISINYPWEIIIEKGKEKIYSPMTALAPTGKFISLKSKKIKEHIVKIDFSRLVNCCINTPLSQEELKGIFRITFLYNYEDKIIKSNSINIEF